MPTLQTTDIVRAGAAAPANRYSGFNLGTALSALGGVSTIAFPWYAEVNRHEEAQRLTAATERVGLASYGAGRADTYALTPQPYAFDAMPRSTSVSAAGGGFSILSGLGPWIPLLVIALVLMVALKR